MGRNGTRRAGGDPCDGYELGLSHILRSAEEQESAFSALPTQPDGTPAEPPSRLARACDATLVSQLAALHRRHTRVLALGD